MNDVDWKQPALIGGAIVGVLSAIPVISAGNCFFCAWALIGGAVASRMVINKSQRAITSGDGAKVGLMAGLIGFAIFILVSIPIILSGVATDMSLRLMSGIMSSVSDPNLQETINQAIEQAKNQSAAQRLVSSLPFLLVQGVILGAFTVLGGLLGVAIFEKRKGQPPSYSPPYPPQ